MPGLESGFAGAFLQGIEPIAYLRSRPRLLEQRTKFGERDAVPVVQPDQAAQVTDLEQRQGTVRVVCEDLPVECSGIVLFRGVRGRNEEPEVGLRLLAEVLQAREIDLAGRDRRLVGLLCIVDQTVVGQGFPVAAETGIEDAVRPWLGAALPFVFETQDAKSSADGPFESHGIPIGGSELPHHLRRRRRRVTGGEPQYPVAVSQEAGNCGLVHPLILKLTLDQHFGGREQSGGIALLVAIGELVDERVIGVDHEPACRRIVTKGGGVRPVLLERGSIERRLRHRAFTGSSHPGPSSSVTPAGAST